MHRSVVVVAERYCIRKLFLLDRHGLKWKAGRKQENECQAEFLPPNTTQWERKRKLAIAKTVLKQVLENGGFQDKFPFQSMVLI